MDAAAQKSCMQLGAGGAGWTQYRPQRAAVPDHRWHDVARAWGGPALAGAGAVHAALALLLPVELWMLRGLSGLQGRLAARLLGTDQASWVLLVAALGLVLLWAFINQL